MGGGLQIQIGAGQRPIPGFTNIDPRPVGPHAIRGHACDLSSVADGAADLVFSHAVFEHLYLGQQVLALREWARVLGTDGHVVCLGIPDFEEIARLYLAKAPGVVSPTFDLFEVYRYTHGDPEDVMRDIDWTRWSPRHHLNDAPTEWLPQLHKTLLDAPTVDALVRAAGLVPSIVRYRYPNEAACLNLAVVAGRTQVADPVGVIAAIPTVERFVDLSTVTPVACGHEQSAGLADHGVALADVRVTRTRQLLRGAKRRAQEARTTARRLLPSSAAH